MTDHDGVAIEEDARDAPGQLVETTERRCPSCRSEQVAPIGQLTDAFGGHQFVLSVRGVRAALRVRPRIAAGSRVLTLAEEWSLIEAALEAAESPDLRAATSHPKVA